MAAGQTHLDEIQHIHPAFLEAYTHPEWPYLNKLRRVASPAGDGSEMIPLENADLVHRYLRDSPFFDHTTKNGAQYQQSENNMEVFNRVEDRAQFERLLKQQTGVEYMITGEPAKLPAGDGSTLVWNIRKQDRRKPNAEERRRRLESTDQRRRQDAARQLQEGKYDHLETLGTYFIVGESLYQAPSLGDLVGNRLLGASTALSKVLAQAEKLATWDPSGGYRYTAAGEAGKSSVASRAGSPSQQQSREGSMAPATQVSRSGSIAPEGSQETSSTGAGTANNAAPDLTSQRLLAQSLQMSLHYGDEFMDENPLQGEPGHFSFTSSTAAVQKRKADAAAKAAREEEEAKKKREAAAAANPFASAAGGGDANGRKAEGAVERLAKGEAAAGKEARRSSKHEGAKKRKKSRGINGNTPGATPRSAVTPGGPS